MRSATKPSKYEGLESDFTEGKMGIKFSNLKGSLRKHLKSEGHKAMIKKEQGKEVVEAKEDARNKRVGKTIGGMVYHLVFHARPDADLTILIYLAKKGGADVGDINHSYKLVSSLLPDLASRSSLAAEWWPQGVSLLSTSWRTRPQTRETAGSWWAS